MNREMDMSGKMAELAAEMMKEKDAAKTEKENLILAYEKRIPGVSGEEVVRDLLKGDSDFGNAMEGDAVNQSETQGKVTIGQQYNRAVDLINEVIGLVNDNPQYGMGSFEQIGKKAEDEVTAEDLDFIKRLLAETGEKFGPLMFESEEMARALSALDTAEFGELDENLMDEEYKHYLALAAFILHQQGELADAVPQEADAYTFGAAISAAVAIAKEKIKALMGKIPWDKVLGIMSKAGKALLSVAVAGGAMSMVVSLLGLGTVIVLSRIVLAIAVVVCAKRVISWIRSDEAAVWLGNLIEKAQSMIVKAGSWVATFLTWVKEKATVLWNNFSEKIQSLSVEHEAHEGAEVPEEEEEEEEEEANPVFA